MKYTAHRIMDRHAHFQSIKGDCIATEKKKAEDKAKNSSLRVTKEMLAAWEKEALESALTSANLKASVLFDTAMDQAIGHGQVVSMVPSTWEKTDGEFSVTEWTVIVKQD